MFIEITFRNGSTRHRSKQRQEPLCKLVKKVTAPSNKLELKYCHKLRIFYSSRLLSYTCKSASIMIKELMYLKGKNVVNKKSVKYIVNVMKLSTEIYRTKCYWWFGSFIQKYMGVVVTLESNKRTFSTLCILIFLTDNNDIIYNLLQFSLSPVINY